MKLTPRLQAAAGKIKIGSLFADIGTDHAYIPIYAVKNDISKRAIATDVRKGPLIKAERNIRLYGLLDRISLRQGSGLMPLSEHEVDCAIMAGMGGYLICDMLASGKKQADTIKYFIFQPIQAPEVLREYLYKNNYFIYDEQLAKENNKIYEIIVAEHGSERVEDAIYYEVGKKLIENKDPLLEAFINIKIDELLKVMQKIKNIGTENARTRYQECASKIKKYEEVLKWL